MILLLKALFFGIYSNEKPKKEIFMDTFIEIIKDLWAIDLLRFAVYLLLAFIVAWIAKFIVVRLFRLIRLDRLLDKWGVNEGELGTSSALVGKLVYIVVFLLFLPSALGALGLHEVSAPLSALVSRFIAYVPNLVAAGLLIYVGVFVAKIIGQIISALLTAVKFDGAVNKIIPQMKMSASRVTACAVKTLIILFVIAQGVEVLGLTVFTAAVSAVVAYLPMVFKSALILLAAFFGASMLENLIKQGGERIAGLAKTVRIVIYVVAGFMILSQLDLASKIVNTAFMIILAAVAVAFAIAFGLGGRDFAKKTLEKVDKNMENK